MSASLASPRKMVWRMAASLVSLAYFRKWPFWRVLALAKNGEFSASTQIRQIRRLVAIAYARHTDGQTERRKDEQTNRWTNGQTNRWADEQMVRKTDINPDRQTDKQRDRWIDDVSAIFLKNTFGNKTGLNPIKLIMPMPKFWCWGN